METGNPVTVSILQSNYIPWKGYFDIIARSDYFVVYDLVQYTKNDWRNRNMIKTRNGLQWLTIPVRHQRLDQPICEVLATDNHWRRKHWKALCQAYSKAPHFADFCDELQALYLEEEELSLSKINRSFIDRVSEFLGLKTKIVDAAELSLAEGQTGRLVDICQSLGAGRYLSGPAARSYLDQTMFSEAGIEIEWMDYSGYPEYEQLNPPFEHAVSIVDLLFNTGRRAQEYMLRNTYS